MDQRFLDREVVASHQRGGRGKRSPCGERLEAMIQRKKVSRRRTNNRKRAGVGAVSQNSKVLAMDI